MLPFGEIKGTKQSHKEIAYTLECIMSLLCQFGYSLGPRSVSPLVTTEPATLTRRSCSLSFGEGWGEAYSLYSLSSKVSPLNTP